LGASRAPQRVQGHRQHPRSALGRWSSQANLAVQVLATSYKRPQTSRPPVPGAPSRALPLPSTGRGLRAPVPARHPQPAGLPRLDLWRPRNSPRRIAQLISTRPEEIRLLTLSAVLAPGPILEYRLVHPTSARPYRPAAIAILPNRGAPRCTAILSGLAWVWAVPNYWPPGTLGREGAGIGMRVREVVTTIG
jgi:hypothetical protein